MLAPVQIFSIDSRQGEFIERVARIADKHSEPGEASGIRAENFVININSDQVLEVLMLS